MRRQRLRNTTETPYQHLSVPQSLEAAGWVCSAQMCRPFQAVLIVAHLVQPSAAAEDHGESVLCYHDIVSCSTCGDCDSCPVKARA